jgi:hypothetical protein
VEADMIRFLLASSLLFVLNSLSYAITDNEVKIVKDSVLELCRGGTDKGNSSSILVEGKGNVTTVMFKKLADVGLSGEAKFSKDEWDGIKPLLPENFDSNAYVKCITDLTPIFLAKFSTTENKPPADPKISLFQSEPSILKEGNTAQLKWNIQDASSVEIDQGIGNVPLSGSRVVSPKATTNYTLTASRDDVVRQATTQITVTPLSMEDQNSIGTLIGDRIDQFKVLSYEPDRMVAEITYRYNPQHGQVWIGAYLLDQNGQNISSGFYPTEANPQGKTQIKVSADPSKGPVQSKWLFFWLYESNKGEGFVSKRFVYDHFWN